MKKLSMIIVAALVLCLGLSSSHAQVSFSIGPRVGISFGNLSFDPEPTLAQGVTKSGTVSILFGAIAELDFGKMFGVMLEPSYLQKGTKFEQGSAKQSFTVGELQIPILCKVRFLQGQVKPYALVGPNLGLVLSSKVKLEGTGNDGETDIKSTTSSMDFGLDFGGGVQFAVTPKVAITADVRYSLGLSNLNNTAGSTQSIKSRGLQIAFGTLFSI